MNSIIKEYLSSLEREHGTEILFAVESGSRAWGFESTDSDYDVRFVYKRPLSWYLSITARRDVIEPRFEFPFDFNGWDLKKALYAIYKGNPCFIEWLNSPMVYLEGEAIEELRTLSKKYFNPKTAIYHYLHMAEGNFREYLKGDVVRWKKYLYVIRPLLCCEYIASHHSMPPVLFEDLLKGQYEIPYDNIQAILEKKKKGTELDTGPRDDVLNYWIHCEISKFMGSARLAQRVMVMPDDLNEYFMLRLT